ncbi:uncharacterized protein LOC125537660 [Triticum urartu]|uniref:uncharacterized protein LOC125537660 n=1 Tax=Triticum urartu TaxID=4572 RepID=UPI002042F43B|nr:uncharacterized protein LOC125537660 [Triticum urartu]
MPPIPIVLEHSFLFPLACAIDYLVFPDASYSYYPISELGRGRKRGPKSGENESVEESLTNWFVISCVVVEIWFGISLCLSFLSFLCAPSSSFLFAKLLYYKKKIYMCIYSCYMRCPPRDRKWNKSGPKSGEHGNMREG